MKIGLVCPYNIFRGGGVQECVLALQAELSKRGHTVHIIAPRPREYNQKAPEHIVLLGGAADFKSPFHTTAQVSVSVKTDALEDVLDTYKFDVLHFHEPWVPILSRQILSRSRAKNIATFHAKLPDTIMSRTFERVITPYTRSIVKYLDSVTAVSTAGAEYIETLSKEPITIVPNGIDLKKYKSKNLSKEPSVLYIGRLEKRKGVKYLIQAFADLKLRQPLATLIIAGDGPDREKLEELVQEESINGVRFLGYVTEAEKLNLFNNAGVFCSPALYGESFGIVLLEAMACGVPVVAGDNPGYSAVMQERGKLSLVNPKHTYDFSRKLELLLFDDDIRQLWRKWAQDYVKQFAYPKVVDQYEAVYRRAVKD
jgi:phosphatidylinositol alpha-mannosyltransferase